MTTSLPPLEVAKAGAVEASTAMINDGNDVVGGGDGGGDGGDRWDGGVLVLRDVFDRETAATIGNETTQTFATAPRSAVDGGIVLAPTTATAPVLNQARLLVTNSETLRRRMKRLLPPLGGGDGGGGSDENLRYMLSVGDAFTSPLSAGSLLTSDGKPRRTAPPGTVWISWANCRCNPPLPSQHLHGVAARLCIGHVVYVYAGDGDGDGAQRSDGPHGGAVFRWIPNAANAASVDDVVSQAPTGFIRHAPRAAALTTVRAVVLRPGDVVVVARNVVHHLPMVQSAPAAPAVAAQAASAVRTIRADPPEGGPERRGGGGAAGAYVAMYACAPMCAVNAATAGAVVATDMTALLCMSRQSVYDWLFDAGYDLARYHRGYAALFVDAADSATRPVADAEPPRVCAACTLR